jgi:hypothetical protein
MTAQAPGDSFPDIAASGSFFLLSRSCEIAKSPAPRKKTIRKIRIPLLKNSLSPKR